MNQEEQVLLQLKAIIDPDLKKDIVSLGFIKNLTIGEAGAVSFTIELTTPACPVKDDFKIQAERLVKRLEWVTSVQVDFSAQKKNDASLKNLARVGSIIAVSSCKGGVGKSTVAVNLAACLAKKGAKVGLFDADIYGPSLATMVAYDEPPELDGKELIPVDASGLKMMSFGFLEDADRAAILRGPMVTQIIHQLLLNTRWGELDYMILDFPPGTGDIQLTLCQLLQITAAITVTTPQLVSFIDVIKGIELFDTLEVPVVGVVENMSYFEVDGQQHFPFGKGSMRRLVHEFGFEHTLQLPIDESISRGGDTGKPFVLDSSPNSDLFSQFVSDIVQEVSKIAFGPKLLPFVNFDPKIGVLVKPNNDIQPFHIGAKALRLACRNATNRNEFTDELLIDPDLVPVDIHPLSMNPVGNYALGIHWSDGHSSLYPFKQLFEFA